ncbi:MAG: hypothetical protein J6S14_02340 [Clostridia bacterium]|nr:hypothetical protein [Clostridia bacterium]
MKEYIEREAAIRGIVKYSLKEMANPDIIAKVLHVLNDNVPAADVREVVRGKWIKDCDYHFRCSVCGDRWVVSNGKPLDIVNGWSYCPNCGADMRQKEEP